VKTMADVQPIAPKKGYRLSVSADISSGSVQSEGWRGKTRGVTVGHVVETGSGSDADGETYGINGATVIGLAKLHGSS
jgi:hypothetical protein